MAPLLHANASAVVAGDAAEAADAAEPTTTEPSPLTPSAALRAGAVGLGGPSAPRSATAPACQRNARSRSGTSGIMLEMYARPTTTEPSALTALASLCASPGRKPTRSTRPASHRTAREWPPARANPTTTDPSALTPLAPE